MQCYQGQAVVKDDGFRVPTVTTSRLCQEGSLEVLQQEYADLKKQQLFNFSFQEENNICGIQYSIGQGHLRIADYHPFEHQYCVTHDFEHQSVLISLYVGHKGEDVAIYCKQNLHNMIIQHPGYRTGRQIKAAITDCVQSVDEEICQRPSLQNQAGSFIIMIKQQNRVYVGGLGCCRGILQESDTNVGQYIVRENTPEDVSCNVQFRNSGGQLVAFHKQVLLTNFKRSEYWDVSKCFGAANFKKSEDRDYFIISNKVDVQMFRLKNHETRYLLLTCGDIHEESGRGMDWMINTFLNNKIQQKILMESIVFRVLNKRQIQQNNSRGVICALISFDSNDFETWDFTQLQNFSPEKVLQFQSQQNQKFQQQEQIAEFSPKQKFAPELSFLQFESQRQQKFHRQKFHYQQDQKNQVLFMQEKKQQQQQQQFVENSNKNHRFARKNWSVSLPLVLKKNQLQKQLNSCQQNQSKKQSFAEKQYKLEKSWSPIQTMRRYRSEFGLSEKQLYLFEEKQSSIAENSSENKVINYLHSIDQSKIQNSEENQNKLKKKQTLKQQNIQNNHQTMNRSCSENLQLGNYKGDEVFVHQPNLSHESCQTYFGNIENQKI